MSSIPYLLVLSAWQARAAGKLSHVEVGKIYILKLRLDFCIKNLVGVREELLERQEQGENVDICILGTDLPLVGQNKLHFKVAP